LAILILLPKGATVYILGGPVALNSGIDAELQNLGFNTQRISGDTQYGTAVAIAQAMGNPSTVFEATGTSFADALSAVPAAIATGGAILLTNGSTQNSETAAYLQAHPPKNRYAIGGPQAAAGADPSATPVYGADLYGTSAAVASQFFPKPANLGFATGNGFADALGGGPFMGVAGTVGPMLLVAPNAPLPQSIANYVSATKSSVTQAFLFGGAGAVGDDVVQAVEAIG
ncbi:MAG TPA: cell wall-binding repeat-containing protein, partial [Acidimicrobiales bacterium]|nr:cell wall-binding repeat-containing protein [Acidimicrobiales bacterium]